MKKKDLLLIILETSFISFNLRSLLPQSALLRI